MHSSTLPQFTIDDMRGDDEGPDNLLIGHFSHVTGIRNQRGWLIRSISTSIIGDLTVLPTPNNHANVGLRIGRDESDTLNIGDTLPWLDGFWQAYHVFMILEGTWTRQTFVPRPSRHFRIGSVHGWRPDDATPLAADAVDLGTRPDGWDHEHCELCNKRIGAAGFAEGYVSAADQWLCPECHAKYAEPRSLAFAVET